MTEITVTATLDTAAILALNATPLELVPAPAAGKILVINDGWIRFDVGTTPAAYLVNAVFITWGVASNGVSDSVAYNPGNDAAENPPFIGSNNQLFSLMSMRVASDNEGVGQPLTAWLYAAIDPTGITDLGTAYITIIYEEIDA